MKNSIHPSRRQSIIRIGSGIATGSALIALPAYAQQSYPNKPIRLIVPVAAGGGSDFIARQVSERLGRSLGGSIVVENIVTDNTT